MLEKALVDLVSHMIRLKLLDNARFRGLFAIAVDGTKQERIRFTFKEGRMPTAYADAQGQMAAFSSHSGTLVRHTAHGKRVECGSLSWATGVEISREFLTS